jgi:hypothetical protein
MGLPLKWHVRCHAGAARICLKAQVYLSLEQSGEGGGCPIVGFTWYATERNSPRLALP